MAQGLVPNFELEFKEDQRRGQTVKVESIDGTNTRFKSIKKASFKIEGAQIFNAMPKDIRGYMGSKESFKRNLDNFLSTIPDEPEVEGGQVPSALDFNVKPSNSLKDWVRTLKIYNFQIEEEDVAEEDNFEDEMPVITGSSPIKCSCLMRSQRDSFCSNNEDLL